MSSHKSSFNNDDKGIEQRNYIGNNSNSMNEKYDFNISEIFKRAHQLSKQNNWTIVLGLLCILAFSFSAYLVFLNIFGVETSALLDPENSPLTSTQQLMIEMTLTVLLAPVWTGVAMLAIFTARQKKMHAMSIFSYYTMLPVLAIASVIVSVFLTFGIMLLFLPGFYVFVATTFTLPLVADKKLSPVKAILSSVKMVNTYLSKMILLYLLFVGMLLLVIISFGVAYLWVGPFYFNVKAILYQDLFCREQQVELAPNSNKNDEVFDA